MRTWSKKPPMPKPMIVAAANPREPPEDRGRQRPSRADELSIRAAAAAFGSMRLMASSL
jgi:hypothetical protein